MSRWETLSYKESDRVETAEIMVGSKGTAFDGETCWLSHDVVDGYVLSVSDTRRASGQRRFIPVWQSTGSVTCWWWMDE